MEDLSAQGDVEMFHETGPEGPILTPGPSAHPPDIPEQVGPYHLLEQTVGPQSDAWLEECFKMMDRASANSRGLKWNREDLYDV